MGNHGKHRKTRKMDAIGGQNSEGGAELRVFVLEGFLAPRGPKEGPRRPKKAPGVNFVRILGGLGPIFKRFLAQVENQVYQKNRSYGL